MTKTPIGYLNKKIKKFTECAAAFDKVGDMERCSLTKDFLNIPFQE